jgi:hypothetical protein
MMHNILKKLVGRDISVDIATCHRLDGNAIESRWGLHFAYPLRLSMVPTQLAVVGKTGGVVLTTHPI